MIFFITKDFKTNSYHQKDLKDKDLGMLINKYNKKLQIWLPVIDKVGHGYRPYVQEKATKVRAKLNILLKESDERNKKDRDIGFKRRQKREIGETSFSNKNINIYLERYNLK